MVNREKIELILREIEDANTPEESAAFRSLMEVEPPPHLRRAILAALPKPSPASPKNPIVRWTRSQLKSLTALTEAFMTRKTMIYAGATLAIVIVIAAVVIDFPPLSGTAGTMGDPPGVQQAARYHGRTMTTADVSLDNPQIKALLQNDRILRLVKSDVFREVMNTAAFRELQSSAAYRELMTSDAYRVLLSNEAFRELQQNDAYHELMSSEAARDLQRSAAYHELMSNDAYRELQTNEAFRELQSSAAYREIMTSEAYREIMSSEAYRELQANDTFRELQASDLFRGISRDAQLSELFMSEVMQLHQ